MPCRIGRMAKPLAANDHVMKRKKPRRSHGSGMGLLLVLAGAGGVLGICLLACAGGGVYFFFFANRINPEKELIGQWDQDDLLGMKIPIETFTFRADGTFTRRTGAFNKRGTWRTLSVRDRTISVELTFEMTVGKDAEERPFMEGRKMVEQEHFHIRNHHSMHKLGIPTVNVGMPFKRIS
jgi:hypothetical protein